jgi:hypothetical protein
MTVDSGDRDYYSPEEKRRLNAEWGDSEAGRRFYKGVEREERKAAVVGAIVWIAAGLFALVVAAALVKWAIEELAK